VAIGDGGDDLIQFRHNVVSHVTWILSVLRYVSELVIDSFQHPREDSIWEQIKKD